jgi:subtilisin family serine protease
VGGTPGSPIVTDQYIIQLRDGVQDVPGLARQLAAQSGGQLGFTYTAVLKGFSARMSAQAAAALQQNPNVLLVEPDVVVTADTTMQSGATWGLDRIDQRPLPLNSSYKYQETGAGVTVYIIDTGIRYTHTEFGGRASFGFDAFGGTGADCHGHGTHVAGTVGGAKYGVAKGVKLVAVRVLDCNGSGSGSGVIAGMDWVAKNGPRPGVVNMSLGGGASQSLDDAVKRLHQAGIGSAVAAGNSNLDACTASPARAPEAMTVGASDNKDARASFSNYGSCVDWFAPGVGIASAMSSSDVATASMSGTSMAAPHVAGAAALFLERNPGATPQQVRDGLFAQTTKGKVTSAASANNHLLYTFGDADGSWTPPPPGPPVPSFSQLCIDLT